MRVWFDTLWLVMEKSWGAVALMETASPAQKGPLAVSRQWWLFQLAALTRMVRWTLAS
jgi:hypothetical protein